jgi:1-aminocyclopropane-1-carboxylate deaminase
MAGKFARMPHSNPEPQKHPNALDQTFDWLGREFVMRRLDLGDVAAPGNKWYKLRLNIERAERQPSRALLTFGGPFSNHLLATARTCAEHGLAAIGIVRGGEVETPVMRACEAAGMTLQPVSRAEYGLKTDPDYLHALREAWGNPWIVPEGGANDLGVHGAQDLYSTEDQTWDAILVPVGTGTTLAGMALKSGGAAPIVGVSALKGVDHAAEVQALLARTVGDHEWAGELLRNTTWWTDAHEGGFGKMSPELEAFLPAFQASTGIPLDRVYTGKMMLRLKRELERPASERLPALNGSGRILILHTGGVDPLRKPGSPA